MSEDDARNCASNRTRCIKEAFLSDRGRLACEASAPRAVCAFGCGAYGDGRLSGLCKPCFNKLHPDQLARLRVDHLVYAVPGTLEAACADFEEKTGVRPQPGGRHEGLGTHNALVSLGQNRYFEILCRDPAQPDPPRTWMAMDSLGDSPRLVAWAALRPDLDQAVGAARECGYDPGTPSTFRARRSLARRCAGC